MRCYPLFGFCFFQFSSLDWLSARLIFFIFIFSFLIAANGGTHARAALRWLCGLGFGRHGRECVVIPFLLYFVWFGFKTSSFVSSPHSKSPKVPPQHPQRQPPTSLPNRLLPTAKQQLSPQKQAQYFEKLYSVWLSRF